MSKRTFPATLDQLHEMLIFIHAYGLAAKLPDETLHRALLAAEEALVNVMHYAYPDKDRKGLIELECTPPTEAAAPSQGIKIAIKDFGIPFDPVAHLPLHLPSPSAILGTKEFSQGGFGIWMLVKLMDSVDYTRVEDGNQLILVKLNTKT